jgi:hypothetical protein
MTFFGKPRKATSRRPFRRPAVRLFAVPAAAVAALAATQATASAAGGPFGPTSTVTQTTAAGYCEAGISFYYNSYLVADGWLRNTSQYSCTAWMETSRDGVTFTQSSPAFTLPAYSGTAWHGFTTVYDQAPLLSRTCFKFPWAGAAHHCTGAG